MNSRESSFRKIKSPQAVRESCRKIYDASLEGETNFSITLDKLNEVADLVVTVSKENYPDLDIPFHSRMRHFSVGGKDRIHSILKCEDSNEERCRKLIDLIVVSVLLDAGAGKVWQFNEDDSSCYSRSEGLAVASFHMFQKGLFSCSKGHQVTSKGLQNLTIAHLEQGFQSNDENRILGLEGRFELLENLASSLKSKNAYFVNERPGGLLDFIRGNFGDQIKASELMYIVIEAFGDIWPGRHKIQDQNLGDAWPHPLLAQETEPLDRYVVFHKLSQWLTYSLMEPLSELGVKITDIDEMTGLAEYRNGGLFFDGGVLNVRDTALLDKQHSIDSEFIIEWRALTIILLDKLAIVIREKLSEDSESLPLVKILEGGTWWAGRKLANEKRPGGTPPFKMLSDGTIF